MTKREYKIVKALLRVLHNLDGVQIAEAVLHAEVNLHVTPTASLAEFDGAVAVADSNRWITVVQAKFGAGRKFTLSDAGEAALLEMS